MKTVFYADRTIHFAASAPPGAAATQWFGNDIANILQKFGNSNVLWIISPDWRVRYGEFVDQFSVVPASGGVVRDAKGHVLMILRNGRWDLPKGRREAGETSAECAVREVEEECGLHGLQCGRLLLTTLHIYRERGRWFIKPCDWFAMLYLGDENPVPQAAEGIRAVDWVAPGRIEARTRDSFETIRNVIHTYLNEN